MYEIRPKQDGPYMDVREHALRSALETRDNPSVSDAEREQARTTIATLSHLFDVREDGSVSAPERVSDPEANHGGLITTRAQSEAVKTAYERGKQADKRAYVSGNEVELRGEQSWFEYQQTRGLTSDSRLPKGIREAGSIDERMPYYNEWFSRQLRETHPAYFGNVRTTYGLEEGINTGSAGSAQSLVATILGHDVIDLIRAKTFIFKAGATMVPMPSEFYNLPTWEADVAPAYLTEASAASLDTTPQTGIVKFVASNAWVDNTAASVQAIEDAYNNGGIGALLMNSISEKWARKMDSLAVYGDNSAVTNQAPGWLAESIMTQSMGADGAAPTDYSDVSKAAAQVRAQNVEPNAILSHPSVMAQYAQLVSTTGQPMMKTPDIANLPWYDSGTLNGYTETQGSSNVASSVYVGDFSWVKVGVRNEPALQIRELDQRYADQLLCAWLSYFRGAFRVVRPTQTICVLQGVLAS